MRLSYAQCISKSSIYIPRMCHIHSPTLKEIYDLGFCDDGNFVYDHYLKILSMTPKDWVDNFYQDSSYINIPEQQEINAFDALLSLPDGVGLLKSILSFFITDTVDFSMDDKCFIIYKDNLIVGVINKDNFKELCNIIFQLSYIETETRESVKPKNKIAERILKKLSQQKKKNNTNVDINIPNLISKVCCNHNSYNFTNIWSLTVYQLYDQFYCLNNKICIDESMRRWAVWGSEPFDFNVWFKQIK